jgi:hypothetical protein
MCLHGRARWRAPAADRPRTTSSDSHEHGGAHEGPITHHQAADLDRRRCRSSCRWSSSSCSSTTWRRGDKPAAGSDALGRPRPWPGASQPVAQVELTRRVRPLAMTHAASRSTRPLCARLPRRRCGRRAQARRRRGLGAAHQDRLRGAAELGAQGQGRHGRARRRRLLRLRDRPRRWSTWPTRAAASLPSPRRRPLRPAPPRPRSASA